MGGGGLGGWPSAGWVGLKLWTPPPYNSEGLLGWAPATPSFFGHRCLVWLFAGAPFRFVLCRHHAKIFLWLWGTGWSL